MATIKKPARIPTPVGRTIRSRATATPSRPVRPAARAASGLAGADADYAERLALAFDRVLYENCAGVRGSAASLRVFRRAAGRSRLDTDAAILITRQGLKSKAISDWLDVTQLPKKGLYDGLRLSPSTLSRKGKDQRLDAAVTERLVRQSELMVKAAEVFGEAAATWMTKSHALLGGSTPIDAAATEYGGTKVREILNAIEHGGVV